ncbi:MAG: RsmE family RNA methyltransferase [Candidatus Bruticola sp.]
MRITRVFSPQKLSVGLSFALDSDTSKHLTRVMRLRVGQEFVSFDNSGAEFVCRLTEIARHGLAQGEVLSASFPDVESACRLRICLSIVKGERFDWAVEKLTELGVAEIVPIQTEFTQVIAPADNKRERWQRLAAGAAGQSGRVMVPEITAPMSFTEALIKYSAEGTCIMFNCGAEPFDLKDEALSACTIFIGPEGGFSLSELQAAEASGCRFYSLGKRILRVETAALAAASRLTV